MLEGEAVAALSVSGGTAIISSGGCLQSGTAQLNKTGALTLENGAITNGGSVTLKDSATLTVSGHNTFTTLIASAGTSIVYDLRDTEATTSSYQLAISKKESVICCLYREHK